MFMDNTIPVGRRFFDISINWLNFPTCRRLRLVSSYVFLWLYSMGCPSISLYNCASLRLYPPSPLHPQGRLSTSSPGLARASVCLCVVFSFLCRFLCVCAILYFCVCVSAVLVILACLCTFLH